MVRIPAYVYTGISDAFSAETRLVFMVRRMLSAVRGVVKGAICLT
jgi:hypothetical protein